MLTKEISEFNAVETIEKLNKTPRLLLEAKSTKKQIEVLGKVLEAQYRIEENFLVLVTEGNPMEEALYVHYFSDNFHLMDSLELSAMYSEGMLRNLSLSDSGHIYFSFFDNDEQWVLKVSKHPKYSFFKNRHPVKRKMSVFTRGWLSLEKFR